VNKLAYRLGEVQRGDVIVFNGADSWQEITIPPPDNAVNGLLGKIGSLFGFTPLGEKDFIKRVIGLPGDTVTCCDEQGRITVNGKALDESEYLYPGDRPSLSEFSVKVPPGRLWVMGDHRSASADSRAHQNDPGNGTIPIDHVVGRAFIIVWPLDRIALLTRPPAYADAGLAMQSEDAVPLVAVGVGLPALAVLGSRRLTALPGRRERRSFPADRERTREARQPETGPRSATGPRSLPRPSAAVRRMRRRLIGSPGGAEAKRRG